MKLTKQQLIKIIKESLSEAPKKSFNPQTDSTFAAINTKYKVPDGLPRTKVKSDKDKEKKKKFDKDNPKSAKEAIEVVKDAMELKKILKFNSEDFIKQFKNLPEDLVKALKVIKFVEIAVDPKMKVDDKKGELGFVFAPSMKAKLPKGIMKKFGLDKAFIKLKPGEEGASPDISGEIAKSIDLPDVAGFTDMSLELGGNFDPDGFYVGATLGGSF